MLSVVDTGYKNVDIGYNLIIQFSLLSNVYAKKSHGKIILHLVQLPTITEVIIIIVLFIEFQ